MKKRLFVLALTIFLVVGFLPLILGLPCPEPPYCWYDSHWKAWRCKGMECTKKAFPGSFCYMGKDVTDTILNHYVIDGKFYLPENTTILACTYKYKSHCANTAYGYIKGIRKFSICKEGEIHIKTIIKYKITATREDLVRIIKNWVYPSYEDFVKKKNKRRDLPLEVEDIDSEKLSRIKKTGNNSAFEDLIIKEILQNTANRLNREGYSATYTTNSASYGKLVVRYNFIQEETYYISFEKVFEQIYSEGLETFMEEQEVDTSEASGVLAENVAEYTINVTNTVVKLFW